MMTPEEEQRKIRCSTCKYSVEMCTSTMVKVGERYQNIACGYMLAKKKRRPCPADGCTVYEERKQPRKIQPM